MAKLRHKEGVYVFFCKHAERDIAIDAKFKWHREKCRWYTTEVNDANKLRSYADEPTEEALDRRLTSYEKSYAITSDFDVQCPEGLAYWPFQKAGIEWCVERRVSMIADEMGTGKSIQAAGIMNHMIGSRSRENLSVLSVLVVCPAVAKYVWEEELNKWLIKKHYIEVIEGMKGFIPSWEDIIIINYDLFTSEHIRTQLLDMEFDIGIFDECHYMKSGKAIRTKAALYKRFKISEKDDTGVTIERFVPAGIALKCKKLVLLSGTPIESRPSELFPILSRLSPATIAPYTTWLKYVYRYCNAFKAKYGLNTSGSSREEELNERLRSTLMIRRLKKDVLPQLPPKRYQIVPLVLNKDTKKVVKHEQDEVRIVDLKRQKLQILKDDKWVNAGIGDIAKLRKAMADAKLPLCIEYIAEKLEYSDEKFIVFAHHKHIVDALCKKFKQYSPVRISGRESSKQKFLAAKTFQNDDNCRLAVGNIKAAGVNLTLTKSCNAIFVEFSWIPGEIHQAVDRLHRMTQERHVLAQFLAVRKSIDEHMLRDTLVDKHESIRKIVN